MTSLPKTSLFLTALVSMAAACSSDTTPDLPPAATGGTTGSGGAGGQNGTSVGGGGMTGTGGVSTGGAGGMGTGGMGGMAAGGRGGMGGMGGMGMGGMAMGGMGGMAMGGMGGMAPIPVCGNAKIDSGETCDDANAESGDGCSIACILESGYVCATPGLPCVRLCGDGMKMGAEACDDSNALSSDGCSSTCAIEPGFTCATVGAPCTSTCGDSVVVRGEVCDDGNTTADDGCSTDCKTVQDGFVCDIPGSPCRQAPNCPGGVCVSECGDGLKFTAEACDDGNLVDGDGCSATCTVEAGFTCTVVTAELPAQIAVPVTMRDFISKVAGGSMQHPDFGTASGTGITPGMVEATLGGDGLPVYTGVCETASANLVDPLICPFGQQTSTAANFAQWYTDVPGVNLVFPGALVFNRQGQTGTYIFDAPSPYLPLTGRGWDAEVPAKEALTNGGNFGFTTEMRYWFRFEGGEILEFSGDDDVWVFIGGKLAVDVGGVHPKQVKSVTLDPTVATSLGLVAGNTYEIALFQAERKPVGSNFKLTLTGFENAISECVAN